MTSSPDAASTLRPFTEIVTVDLTSVKGASSLVDVPDELVTEHRDRRVDRRGNRRSEDADRRLLGRPEESRRDVVAEVEQEVDVFHAPSPVFESVHCALDPARSFAARRALATRLAREEPGDAPRSAHHAVGLVHHDDGPRA